MKKGIFLLLAIFLFSGGMVSARDKDDDDELELLEVLEFDTMVGVSGPFQGTTNPIRGISGGGLPWVPRSGEGRVVGRRNDKGQGQRTDHSGWAHPGS